MFTVVLTIRVVPTISVLKPLMALLRPASTAGLVLFSLGKLEEAEKVARQGIDMNSNSRTCRAILGDILLERGRHEEGLRQLRIANGAIVFGTNKWDFLR